MKGEKEGEGKGTFICFFGSLRASSLDFVRDKVTGVSGGRLVGVL